MSATRLYDFYIPGERGNWCDIVIALIEYLRSGESQVGYLNNDVMQNMLHKDVEGQVDMERETSKQVEKGEAGECGEESEIEKTRKSDACEKSGSMLDDLGTTSFFHMR